MTQFRIKHIDQGLVDEWIPRQNDDGILIGSDVDARDPNELSEAIIDTQDVLLKVSTLSPNAILNPTSGLAERLTILENTAGTAGLQAVYQNGNFINVLPGEPLLFGIQEEFKLDNVGNISFNPVTMRVKGTGSGFLEMTNSSIFTVLGDLLIAASTAGQNLTLQSAGDLFLKDLYLNSPVTLSEPGGSSLSTTSQSLVGAINEIVIASGTDSLQTIYNQSAPATITTGLGPGTFQIVDPLAIPLGDAFRVTGNATVTKKFSAGNLAIGTNTTIKDGVGVSSTDLIKSTVEVETPLLNANLNNLTLQDKRLSINLTDAGVAGIDTGSQSVVGAINELKADISSVGGALTVFDEQHSTSTGEHLIITTQADVGLSAVKRIIVKNDLGIEQFSINGNGDLIANELTLSGLDVVNLLGLLNSHLSDDGTSHAAVANHLVAANPHNTVSLLQSLNGAVTLSSPDGSISIGTVANTIELRAVGSSDLQDAYDTLPAPKVLGLTADGLRFHDTFTTNLLMAVREADILFQRNLNLNFFGAKIVAANDLTVESSDKLTLTSTTEDAEIATVNANKAVILQGVPFDQTSVKTLPTLGGTSVLGNLKTLDEDKSLPVLNGLTKTFVQGSAITTDEYGLPWLPITTVHPGNEFESGVDFFFSNLSNVVVAAEDIVAAATGKTYKEGVLTTTLAGAPDAWKAGADMYLGKTGYSEWEIVNIGLLANLDIIVIDDLGIGKELTALTGIADPLSGEFTIVNTGNANLDSDETRSNIISLVNSTDFMEFSGSPLHLRGTIDGEAARGAFTIDTQPIVGNSVTITPHASMAGTAVTLTAVADTATPGYLEWRVGLTPEEAAVNLAEAISRTTFFSDLAGTTDGHFCYARAAGTAVRLEWNKPGLSGREIVLSDNTANIGIVAFTGGDCKMRIYRQDRGGAVLTVDSLTAALAPSSAITTSSMSQDESPVQYILEDRAKASSRRTENETSYRVASIEQAAGSIVKYKVRQE